MSSRAFEYIDDLTDDELDDLYKDLISFADYRLNFITTQGMSAKDFVGRAIRKVLDENSDDHRSWDPDTNPSFTNFLKGCISSEISNHFNLKSTSTTHHASNDQSADSFFDLLESEVSVLEEVLGKDLRDQLFDHLVEIDEELAELLFFEEEGYSADEIADKLNYDSRQKVYNAKKRLRRACEKFLDNLKS
ncbi:MAG TPA: hypothetical protein VE912_21165 [Bacteroidales bacterium]|nr:hypothetical protein [Bacteroidales bacterium]